MASEDDNEKFERAVTDAQLINATTEMKAALNKFESNLIESAKQNDRNSIIGTAKDIGLTGGGPGRLAVELIKQFAQGGRHQGEEGKHQGEGEGQSDEKEELMMIKLRVSIDNGEERSKTLAYSKASCQATGTNLLGQIRQFDPPKLFQSALLKIVTISGAQEDLFCNKQIIELLEHQPICIIAESADFMSLGKVVQDYQKQENNKQKMKDGCLKGGLTLWNFFIVPFLFVRISFRYASSCQSILMFIGLTVCGIEYGYLLWEGVISFNFDDVFELLSVFGVCWGVYEKARQKDKDLELAQRTVKSAPIIAALPNEIMKEHITSALKIFVSKRWYCAVLSIFFPFIYINLIALLKVFLTKYFNFIIKYEIYFDLGVIGLTYIFFMTLFYFQKGLICAKQCCSKKEDQWAANTGINRRTANAISHGNSDIEICF